jgi:Family of unknown function (DUF5681)
VNGEKKLGRWPKGKSGNPRGRPRGTGLAAELRAKLAKDASDILKAVITQAKAGDTAAIKLVLDRLVPTLRPVDMPVMLALPKDAGLAERGEAILQAVATGELTPAQAGQLLSGLADIARLREVDDLARRIEALEVGRGQ